MTLIEVVTGLVILGTVLASLAVARGRFARQWAEADQKLAATRALDALIAEWMSGAGNTPRVPYRGEGPLAGVRNGLSRAQTLRDPAAAQLNAVIVRVEAISRPASRTAAPTALASVDLLVHVVPPRPVTRPATRGAR